MRLGKHLVVDIMKNGEYGQLDRGVIVFAHLVWQQCLSYLAGQRFHVAIVRCWGSERWAHPLHSSSSGSSSSSSKSISSSSSSSCHGCVENPVK